MPRPHALSVPANSSGVSSLYIKQSHASWRVRLSAALTCTKHQLALTLLVLRVLTDYSDTTFSFNDFAFFTNWFYWWSNLHVKSSFPILLCLYIFWYFWAHLSKNDHFILYHQHLCKVKHLFSTFSKLFQLSQNLFWSSKKDLWKIPGFTLSIFQRSSAYWTDLLIKKQCCLFISPHNSSLAQIIWRHL